MNVAVLGAGAWGTALALVLHRNQHSVRLWTHRPEHAAELQQKRENGRYLPGIQIPPEWQIGADLASAVEHADAVILAVPSKVFRSVAQQIAKVRCPIVSVTKGIEYETGLTMSGVLASCAPEAPI